MKMDRFEIRANCLERVTPVRKFRKGSKPGVTGKGPMGKQSNDEEQWEFPDVEPTELEKRRLIGACVEIGVKKVFTSHLYSFAGKVYLQSDGGPIGVRLAGTVARVVMGEWDMSLNRLMKENKMTTWMISRYVDDVTAVVTALRRGVRWDRQQQRLAFCKRWELEDLKENPSPTKKTMEVLKDMMNSIYRNIQVTVEIPENFADNKLPVLDFKCWVEDNVSYLKGSHKKIKSRKILYTFFEKTMSSKFAIMQNSALPIKTKVSSLSNDLVRRMKNVSEHLDIETRVGVVNSFTQRLRRSGYQVSQVRDITVAGLSGYEKIVSLAKQGKSEIHRSAISTSASRYMKKLTGQGEN